MASQDEYKTENPGIVTSDSLAAESIQEGGSFAATSDNRGPMGQPSHSTNTNNTDTTNAVRLEPAPDAEARQASEEWNETAMLNSGLASNVDPASNTGEIDQATREARYGTGNAAPAPGYAAYNASELGGRPKGENLQEGGFDPDAPNASYNTDIGGKKDPGRVALNKFEEDNTPYAGGAGPNDSEISGAQQYTNLKDTEI